MSPEQLKQFSDTGRLNLRFANVFKERVSGSKYLYSVKYRLFPPENRNDAKKESSMHDGRKQYYPFTINEKKVFTESIKVQKFIEIIVKDNGWRERWINFLTKQNLKKWWEWELTKSLAGWFKVKWALLCGYVGLIILTGQNWGKRCQLW